MTESDEGYVEGKIGNPCPDGWRLPTTAEAQGLLDIGFTQSTDWSYYYNDSWTDAQKNATIVNGGFTLKGDSGLFFAAVGFRASPGSSTQIGGASNAVARIWCSDIQSGTAAGKATILQCQRDKSPVFYAMLKVGGCSVRCVKE